MGKVLERVTLTRSLKGQKGVKWTRGMARKGKDEECMGLAPFEGMLANSV